MRVRNKYLRCSHIGGVFRHQLCARILSLGQRRLRGGLIPLSLHHDDLKQPQTT